MTTRYEDYALEIAKEIDELHARVARFEARGLTSRVPGIRARIAKLQSALPKARATAKWAKELYGEWA